jgi:DNA-binding transcriptional regulator YhcF (GntR family)
MAEELFRTPYVHVAHQDGMFVGAISDKIGIPAKEKQWRKSVAEFCGEAIAEGASITTLYSREEYEAFTKDMPMWKDPAERQQQESIP